MNNCQEINIIKIFASQFSSPNSSGEIGIGDDCAVLPIDDERSIVVTTDTLTEDVHFIANKISPEDLAYKALASNISDVISMGALPTYAFLSITLTEKCDELWVTKFSKSLHSLATIHGIRLMGGDTTHSPHAITITITLLGKAENKNIKLRSGAKVGDKIYCCNTLGASAAGLELLLQGAESHPLINSHYRPTLFVQQSKWLSKQVSVTSMMDISDGIAKDLTHILEQSQVGAIIDLDKLPISEIVKDMHPDPIRLALEGGEEYSLLFTINKEQSQEIAADYLKTFSIPIYEIGEICPLPTTISWTNGDKPSSRTFKGYDHFKR